MISVCCLLNWWMDFDQTCIDTLLEEREELIRVDHHLGLDMRKPVFGEGTGQPRSLISIFQIANRQVSYLNLPQAKFQFSSYM